MPQEVLPHAHGEQVHRAARQLRGARDRLLQALPQGVHGRTVVAGVRNGCVFLGHVVWMRLVVTGAVVTVSVSGLRAARPA